MARKTQFDDTTFRTLLDRWNHHEMLRSTHAALADLADSRAELDSARLAAYMKQRYPVAA